METFILLGIIAFVVAAFAFEWMPIDQVALVCLALLLVFGLVSPEEGIAGFSNPAVITVMMMFIVSEGLVKSGLITAIAHRITALAGTSRNIGTTFVLGLAGVLSAFINNTATVSLFMPVSIHLAKHYRFSPSKILLPLSYAGIFGGACTLIGTSTNLLVSALSEKEGQGALGMFEFLPMGIILFVLGMIFTLTVGKRLLPDQDDSTELTGKYELSAFLTELQVPAGSKILGKTVVSEHLSERFRLTVLEILRGKQKIAQDLRYTELQEDDLLIVSGAVEDILSFKQAYNLLMLTDIKLRDSDLADENNILAEVQLSPTSGLELQSLKQIDFRRRFGCFVLALRRHGGVIRKKITSIPLRRWDTLLVFGPRTRVEALYDSGDFVSLQERDIRLRLNRRWWIGALTIPAVVLLASLGVMSILKAAILGAVLMIASGSLRVQEAYKAINWTVIFLVAAILPLGTAMENTGLAQRIGDAIGSTGDAYGPWMVLAIIYLATAILTEIMSNNSTVVLMVPIAVGAAETLGVDAKPFLMAVAFAGSSSFLTPMGYNTNAMVFGPGGYRFADYVRVGLPLKILFWIVTSALVPVIWPF